MIKSEDKIMSLHEAVETIPDGAHISLGGFTIQRHPMAFIHEMIRQGKKNLHLYGHSPGGDWDLLIGAGCVKSVEMAYEADEAFGTIGPRFRLAIEREEIEWEDYSNFGMIQRFTAAAMGIPFIPTRTMLGSDMLEKKGLSPAFRKSESKKSPKKYEVMDCPFTGNKVVLLPPIQPDVTIIHAQVADAQGTVRIYGQSFGDEQQVKAAENVIVTCEEIVETERIRDFPEHNCIPFFRVNAVIEAPYGSHPYACYRYYDYDPEFLEMYHENARDDGWFKKFLDAYIYSVEDWDEYIEKVGGKEKLKKLKANNKLGYASDLRRR